MFWNISFENFHMWILSSRCRLVLWPLLGRLALSSLYYVAQWIGNTYQVTKMLARQHLSLSIHTYYITVIQVKSQRSVQTYLLQSSEYRIIPLRPCLMQRPGWSHMSSCCQGHVTMCTVIVCGCCTRKWHTRSSGVLFLGSAVATT